jgi:hypothetical protein
MRNAYRILVGKPKGKKETHVGGWTISKWILERYDGMVWCGWIDMA